MKEKKVVWAFIKQKIILLSILYFLGGSLKIPTNFQLEAIGRSIKKEVIICPQESPPFLLLLALSPPLFHIALSSYSVSIAQQENSISQADALNYPSSLV
jgi:hypothetical protein